MKLKTLFEIDEPVNWENTPPGDVEQEMDQCTRKMTAARHAFDISRDVLETFKDVILNRWTPGFDEAAAKNKHTINRVEWRVDGSPTKLMVPDDTPNLNKIWPIIKKHADRTVIYSKIYKQNDKKRKELNKEYRKQAMAASGPPGSSPTKILTPPEIAALAKTEPSIKIVGVKGGFASPLESCDHGLYVGPPEQYPDLTSTQVDLFLQIQKGLKKAGWKPLTILYGGRKSKEYGGINFVAMNADHTFAWRKYDPSAGAGQNWVYFSGACKMQFSGKDSTGAYTYEKIPSASMNTSTFVDNPGKYLTAKIK